MQLENSNFISSHIHIAISKMSTALLAQIERLQVLGSRETLGLIVL